MMPYFTALVVIEFGRGFGTPRPRASLAVSKHPLFD